MYVLSMYILHHIMRLGHAAPAAPHYDFIVNKHIKNSLIVEILLSKTGHFNKCRHRHHFKPLISHFSRWHLRSDWYRLWRQNLSELYMNNNYSNFHIPPPTVSLSPVSQSHRQIRNKSGVKAPHATTSQYCSPAGSAIKGSAKTQQQSRQTAKTKTAASQQARRIRRMDAQCHI